MKKKDNSILKKKKEKRTKRVKRAKKKKNYCAIFADVVLCRWMTVYSP